MMSAKPEQVNTITLIYLNHFGMPAFSQARWNRTEVTAMGKKKDKGQSDQKKSPPTDSSVRVIGQKRKR